MPFLRRLAERKLGRRAAPKRAEPSGTSMGGDHWRVAAASVTGVTHLQANEPCEDAWLVEQTQNGYAIAIVSDGAGSSTMGAFAARTICDQFKTLALPPYKLIHEAADPNSYVDTGKDIPLTGPWSEVLFHIEDCLESARRQLLDHAGVNQSSPDDYLATVVGVVAHPIQGSVCFHIGDGSITLFGESDEELLTSQPENGEYLNQTYFLIEDNWREHFRVSSIVTQPLGSAFLMSDGVTDLAYHRRGRVLVPEPRFFIPLSEFLMARDRLAGENGIRKVLDTERARELVNDDKTLVWLKPTKSGR